VKPLVIAHRGASARVRENTVAAFVEARRLGADMVELDVRRTADGALAVLHDPVVPGLGPVCELAAAELPGWLPLLDAAVEACDGMQVNLELKDLPGEPGFVTDRAVAAAVAGWARAADVVDRLLISSFDLAAIDRVHAIEPSVRTAWLTLAGYDQSLAAHTCVVNGHVALHPAEAAVTAALLAEAHELGLTVNTWTVDDPARMRLLAGWGVDGIVTNTPDVLVQALRERRP